MGVEVFEDLREGLEGADVVMMLRLQKERMDGALIPSMREYYHRFGLDAEKLAAAKPDAIVMHPGPMNRGVEIDGLLADDINVSVIQEQVEMGVAVRMAAMDLLARNLRARNDPAEPWRADRQDAPRRRGSPCSVLALPAPSQPMPSASAASPWRHPNATTRSPLPSGIRPDPAVRPSGSARTRSSKASLPARRRRSPTASSRSCSSRTAACAPPRTRADGSPPTLPPAA